TARGRSPAARSASAIAPASTLTACGATDATGVALPAVTATRSPGGTVTVPAGGRTPAGRGDIGGGCATSGEAGGVAALSDSDSRTIRSVPLTTDTPASTLSNGIQARPALTRLRARPRP